MTENSDKAVTAREVITVYDEGWNASVSGKLRGDNPYAVDEPERRGPWLFGWINASAVREAAAFTRQRQS